MLPKPTATVVLRELDVNTEAVNFSAVHETFCRD